ncbi:hypothetical protein ACVI1J_001591 [Bradyrhizobium diazoefficiens]|uniref:hypothetical protein n=1 Tax=Bradyrhizobium diazoefficiens TaxID=1355477 RepID=UPI00272DABCE|nr:hypothetical protein [Bradyrhizobium diazoefficiens]WLA67653.1 hypothetical protein QNN01_13810 [Bradyrhizobium diazoefficiens]
MNQPTRLYRGDLVEVKAPDEILQTLDADGALDHLPFMPEMLQLCGRRFRVSRRTFPVCVTASSPREFRGDDVVTLDGVRCSGAAHDGCQKACMIFWREAWLRKVEDMAAQSQVDLRSMDRLRTRLKVSNGAKAYYCQASELLKATDLLSRWRKLGRLLGGLRAGNFTLLQTAQYISIWLFLKARRVLVGAHEHGTRESTPVESLNLQPGEWVEVKPMQSIIATLDEHGLNRGLWFSPDMHRLCGLRRQVKGRLDKIILDGTGQMRQLRNTVCLEDSTCGCCYMGFGMGGCSRCELTYWREIWLRRSNGPGDR